MTTHYEILKVAPDAPDAVIRAAYRVLAASHHPDRHADSDPVIVERMQRINEARRVLSCPVQRAGYDTQVAGQRRRRASDSHEGDISGVRDDLPAVRAIPRVGAPARPLHRRVAALYAECAALN